MRTCAFGMVFGAAAVGLRNVKVEGDAVAECGIGGFGIADGAHIVVAGGGNNGVGRDGFTLPIKRPSWSLLYRKVLKISFSSLPEARLARRFCSCSSKRKFFA